MTSVNFNSAATQALRTLQSTNAALDSTQKRISTGLKIGEAKDNAAYWSISTTMKSDNKSLSTVKDALGLGAATVDTAYQGLNSTLDVLNEIKAKLTAATQDGVNREAIQAELTELQMQLKSIADSSTFSGSNLLSVDSSAPDYTATTKVVSGLNTDASGNVTVATIDLTNSSLVLFDKNVAVGKDGILDKARELAGVTVGGSNSTLGSTAGGLVVGTAAAGRSTASGSTVFNTGGSDPLTFDNIADKITLSVALDGAVTPTTVTVRLGTVQTALNNSAGSVSITTADEMAKVLTQAFSDAGVAGVNISVGSDGKIKFTSAKTGSTSDVAITAATGVDNDTTAGTLSGAGSNFVATDFNTAASTDVFEKASATMNAFAGPIQFTSSTDKIKFTLGVNGVTPVAYQITKADVDAALGTTDGKINTAADFQAVLATKVPNTVTVGSIMSGKVTFTSNDTTAASAIAVSAVSTEGFTGTAGSTASISISDINISAAKLAERGVDTGDEITATLSAYINVVTAAIKEVTKAASNVGAVASRIQLQSTFVSNLMDTIDKGVSGLVDADMNEESTKLQALQVKQQLGVQALSIANQSAQNVLSLFRG